MRIRIDKLPLFSLVVYVTISCIFGYSLLQQVAFIIAFIFYIADCLQKGKITITPFAISYTLFVAWSFLQIYFEICIDRSHCLTMANTLVLNTLFVWMATHVILTNAYSSDDYLNSFLTGYAVALILIVIGCRETLLSGRLGLISDAGFSFKLGPFTSSISPNGISTWCTISILICLYFQKVRKKPKYNGLLILFIFGSLLSASRKGFLALFISVFIFYVFSANKKGRGFRLIVAIFIILILIALLFEVPFLYKTFGYRIEELAMLIITRSNDVNLVGGSLRTRVNLLDMAISMFNQKPLVGYGANAFSFMNPLHIVADNNYLELLVDGGIIGFLLYYLFVIRDFRAIVKRTSSNNHLFFYLIISVFVVALIADFTSSTYYMRSSLMCFIFLDTGIKIIQKGEKEND